jgi:hypothetical protein
MSTTNHHIQKSPSKPERISKRFAIGPALRRWIVLGAVAAFGCGALNLGCASAPPPPPPKVEVRPPRPHARAVWVPGHWKWKGRRAGHVWIPGHWKVK